ncbi:MAG: DNA topoisomerase IB, partial [Chitinophagaceae bacterium]
NKDHQKAAKAAKLIYVSDKKPGILRLKKGKNYSYVYKGKAMTDATQLERIRKLAIPPSWSNVWICPSASGHIQATGLDLNKRKQYRYHAKWNALRGETKFHRLYEFGKALPLIRKKIKRDMAQPELTEKKVLATAINLMEKTYIRVGNYEYEKMYGSYGLTTLKDKHVTIGKDKIEFTFTGKKGIEHNISLSNKRLAKIIKQCRDVPGKTLFQFYTGKGKHRPIDSGMVNHYIKDATEKDFSAKDFRTWAGTLHALECLRNFDEAADEKLTKRNMLEVLDTVSARLGNTRAVCKKYYIHPGLFQLYEEKKLAGCIEKCGKKSTHKGDFSPPERLLLGILEKCS